MSNIPFDENKSRLKLKLCRLTIETSQVSFAYSESIFVSIYIRAIR